MIFCGLDPSLHSYGICLTDDRGNIQHVESIVPQDTFNDYQRLQYIYSRLLSLLKPLKDNLVVSYECQVPQMRWAANAGGILLLAENIGVTKLAIIQYTKYIYPVKPGDVKRFATGNYNATKESMIEKLPERAKKRILWEIPEHSVNDISDAYYISRLGCQLFKEDDNNE